MSEPRTALVHHWWLGMGGAERVSEAICELFPNPHIFCLLAHHEALPPAMQGLTITTSFLQSLPLASKYYRYVPFLFPLAVELLNLDGFDLVISSDVSVTKGVITAPEACHICYCHSPMRYAWNMFQEYRERLGPVKRLVWSLVAHYLRSFDYAAAGRVDHFAANSNTVRKRIAKYYRREAVVIQAPCDVERFTPTGQVDDYYLFVGRLVGYKRADLAVEAFNRSGKRLLLAGDGPEMRRLRRMALRNVELLGRVSDDALTGLYSRCRALIFPGEEDFGIVPVEAQACGRPVIAYGRGGALETVLPGETGLFFWDQDSGALNQTIGEYEAQMDRFHPEAARRNALRFSKERFKEAFHAFVSRCLAEHRDRFPRHAR